MKVSSQEYNELLHYAYKFVHAQRLSIDHFDLAHDILLSGKLGDETSLYRLCHQLAPAYKNKNEIHISDVQSFTFQNATIEYKYCYHCNQILPIHEMYAGSNYCKPYWYERAKNKRDEVRQVKPPAVRIKTEATVLQQRIVERQEKERAQLSDTYLKKMIYRSGENITIEELRARITAKRNKPKEPKSTQLKNKAILKRAELSDNYIKDILVKNGFSRATITPDMVSEKRNSLLAKRLRKTA